MINNNKKNVQLSLNLKKKGIYEKDDFLVQVQIKKHINLLIVGQNGEVEK